MLKKLFIGGLLIALAGLFAFRFLQHGNREASTVGRVGHRFPRVEVALVERGRIEEAVSVVGSLRAKRQVDVMPKLSGRVMELRVDRGDRVMAGELLARLDDAELRQQVRRAEAALRVAEAARAQRQAELDNLLAELERYRSLHQSGVISSQELDQTRTQVAVARAQLHLADAQVEQAKAELQELQIRREQTRITAPMTGVIGKRYVDPGALVNPNTPIVTILDLETMVSVIHVPERELVQLEVGTPATVIVDAVPDVRFAGRVVRISPLLDPQTRTGEVEIEIPNRSHMLKAEMFARVNLRLPATRETLLVPRDALVYRDAQPGVFVLDADVARFRAVKTGRTQDHRVEILDGLRAGETIVTRGANLLKGGDRVQVFQPPVHAGGE